VAVSLANGFWYVSGWPSGSGAVTWTALASVLLAARPNPTVTTRNFLVGAALAAVVGVVVHYSVLTTTGSFPLLAAVLLPVLMLAALGRSDARAVSGGGYGLVVLGIIEPTNVMQYQLDATLNDVVADLLGLWLAVIAFSALPPPASVSTRRWRARRRMAKGFLASVCAPDFLRPDTDRWLARMFDRLTQVGDEDGACAIVAPMPGSAGREAAELERAIVFGIRERFVAAVAPAQAAENADLRSNFLLEV